MEKVRMNQPMKVKLFPSYWRHVLLGVIVVVTLWMIMSRPPIRQPQEYYNFADKRAFLGIPNFFDVTTNMAFFLVGMPGLWFCLKNRCQGARYAWIALFVGLVSVSLGSSYFHWNPQDDTLVWDRASLTIGFMGLFVALLGEYVSDRLGRVLLVPALILGVASVFYWHWFDDLRLYLWIQFMPILVIPLVMVLFRSGFSHQWLIVVTVCCYVLAKVTEVYDREIFLFNHQLFSGHSIKHILAALGCFAILLMLKNRRLRDADHEVNQPPQSTAPSGRG